MKLNLKRELNTFGYYIADYWKSDYQSDSFEIDKANKNVIYTLKENKVKYQVKVPFKTIELLNNFNVADILNGKDKYFFIRPEAY